MSVAEVTCVRKYEPATRKLCCIGWLSESSIISLKEYSGRISTYQPEEDDPVNCTRCQINQLRCNLKLIHELLLIEYSFSVSYG